MKSSITLTQLDYILAVVRSGSFGAASKSIPVSQPALSEMIIKLENSLGVILFDRKTKPISLTDVGREIVDQARAVVIDVDRIQEIADTWAGQVRGTLRIGIIPTLAPALIPLFFKSMRSKYSDIHLELTEAPTDQLLVLLQKNEIDVAILSTPSDAPGHFIEKPLFYEPFCVYVSKGSPLLKKKSLTLADLENQDLILMDQSHCARDQVLSICNQRRNLNSTTVKGSLQILLSVIDYENGFTLIPQLLSNLVNKSQLRELEGGSQTRKIGMLVNKTYLKKKLIEILKTEILNHLPPEIHLKRERGIKVLPPDEGRFK